MLRTVCVDCLKANCECLEKDQDNIEYIPTEIDSSDLLYEDRHLNVYGKILVKYVERWKSITLLDLAKVMNVNTNTTVRSSGDEVDDTVCKLCLEDSDETRKGHYLLTLYSLSVPLTNRVLVDLFVIWALSRNQPHKLSKWINSITPIDVAFHFFFNCCSVDFKPDENDNYTSNCVKTDRLSILRYIYKGRLNGSIQNSQEVTRIRDDLLSSSSNNINPTDNIHKLCTCNQIKANIGEELMKGRSVKTEQQIFSNTGDALTAKKNKEAQAVQKLATNIIKHRTKLSELSACVIGSNGKIYNNVERNSRIYEDSTRFEKLHSVVATAENLNLDPETGEEAYPYLEEEEEQELLNNQMEDEYDDDDPIEVIDDNNNNNNNKKEEAPPPPSVVNLFDLYKNTCKLCDKLLLRVHYSRFNNLSELILKQRKEKHSKSIQTIVMLLNGIDCEPFTKMEIGQHYSNNYCKMNDFRCWQFYNVLGGSNMTRDEELIQHMLKTSVYSRSCTVCIDLYIAVQLDQLSHFKGSGSLKLKRWLKDTMGKHMI